MATSAGMVAGAQSFNISPGVRGDREHHSKDATGGPLAGSTDAISGGGGDDSSSTTSSASIEGSTFHAILHQVYSSGSNNGADSTKDATSGRSQPKNDSSDAVVGTTAPLFVQDSTTLRDTSPILPGLNAVGPRALEMPLADDGAISASTATDAGATGNESTSNTLVLNAPESNTLPSNSLTSNKSASNSSASNTSASNTSTSNTSKLIAPADAANSSQADGASFPARANPPNRPTQTDPGPSAIAPVSGQPITVLQTAAGASSQSIPTGTSGGREPGSATRGVQQPVSGGSSGTQDTRELRGSNDGSPEKMQVLPASIESASVDESALSQFLLPQPDDKATTQSADTGTTPPQQDDSTLLTGKVPAPRLENPRDIRSLVSATPSARNDGNMHDTSSAAADGSNLSVIATGQNVQQDHAFSAETKTADRSQTGQAPQTNPGAALPLIESSTSSATPAQSGDLVFAARLMPSANSPEPNTRAQDASDSKPHPQVSLQMLEKPVSGPSAVGIEAAPADKGRTASLIEQFVKSDVTVAPASPVAQSQSAAAPVRNDTPGAPTPAPSVTRMDQMIEMPSAAAVSNRDITVRLPDATERGTDVRFVERGGEVHVLVRTSDAEMAQTLRGGLSDFVGRFEHGGIRAEVWRPGQDASSSRNDSESQGSDQKGFGSDKGQQHRENRREAEKPRWVEALEMSAGKQSGQTTEEARLPI